MNNPFKKKISDPKQQLIDAKSPNIEKKDKTLLFVWDNQLRLSRVVTRELKR